MDRMQLVMLALFAAGALWLAWQGAKLWIRRGIRVEAAEGSLDRPTLLYFSSDSCAPCRFQQAPAIAASDRLKDGRARLQEYDALEHPDLARRYRVLTVPTTVVVAPCGDVVAVNYGVTHSEKLRHQLDEAEDACD